MKLEMMASISKVATPAPAMGGTLLEEFMLPCMAGLPSLALVKLALLDVTSIGMDVALPELLVGNVPDASCRSRSLCRRRGVCRRSLSRL